MHRISIAAKKLTEDSQLQKKLNFCQSHFGAGHTLSLVKAVFVAIVLSSSIVFAAEDTSLDEDEFESNPTSTQVSPVIEEPTTNSDLPTEDFANDTLVDSNTLSAPSESEKANTSESPQSKDSQLVEVVGEEPELVEVKQQLSIQDPYKQRRERVGWLFTIGAENLFMSDYTSLIDSNFYEDLFGDDDLTLLQGELGVKYNFTLGSLALSIGYGMGSITDNRIGEDRILEIQKKHTGLTMYFDNLMKEPYVVPYLGGQVWVMDISEEALTSGIEEAITTDFGFTFKAGLLFQLNWLDKDSAKDAYKDHHIQNTYLDVFVTQNTSTQDEENDPDTSTDFNWGAGLKIEF